MEKILTYLEQLDLSEIEAKLYLTLLETGPTSVRDIANAIGIKRTTAYLYVEQLVDKGLINKIVKASHPLIVANSPEESLKSLVENKINAAEDIKAKFPQIVGDINASFSTMSGSDQFEIKYYKGLTGLKKIYEEALQAEEVRTYIKLQEPEPIFSNYFEIFKNAFKENKNLIVREIIYDFLVNRQDTNQLLSLGSRYEYRLMPKTMKITSEDILIYDGKVAIINFKDKQYISGVVIHNKESYNNFLEFFDYIWETLPKRNPVSPPA